MALKSPKYPTWDEDYLRAAIIHYYVDQHHPIRKIADGLKMSFNTVRRVLITAPDVEMREQEERTETQADGTKQRRCRGCGEVLPLTKDYFHRDKTKAGGFGYTCKDCRRCGRL